MQYAVANTLCLTENCPGCVLGERMIDKADILLGLEAEQAAHWRALYSLKSVVFPLDHILC